MKFFLSHIPACWEVCGKSAVGWRAERRRFTTLLRGSMVWFNVMLGLMQEKVHVWGKIPIFKWIPTHSTGVQAIQFVRRDRGDAIIWKKCLKKTRIVVQTGSKPTWHTGSCTCLNRFHICAVFRLVSSMPGGAHNKACRRRETRRSVCRSVGLSGNKHAVNSYQQCGAWCLLLSALHHDIIEVIKYLRPGLGLVPYGDMDFRCVKSGHFHPWFLHVVV